MPSTYTTNLGLEKPATGEQAGVWGNTANNSYDFIDQATDGSISIQLSGSSFSLITQQGADSQGRNKVIVFTGTLLNDATINISPNTAHKIYFVTNATIGGFNLIFQGQGSTGSVFTLQPGYSAVIYADGAGAGESVNGALYNPQFGSVLITSQLTVKAATFASLIISTGSPAAYDLYYRAPATGILTPLPIGTAGQLLQVSSTGTIAWATVAFGVGSPVAASSPGGVFYASSLLPAGNLAQDPAFNWATGVGLGIGMLAVKSLQIGGVLQPQIWLDTAVPATQLRELVWSTSSQPRWAFASPAAAEPGGNVGSDFGLAAYSDTGGLLGWAMMFFRANGHVSVGTNTDGNAQLFISNIDSTLPALVVQGAASQSQPLQVWQNSAGTPVASIDQNGVLTSAGGGGLSLNSQGRLDLHGTVTGHPLGVIHIGPDSTGLSSVNAALAMESSTGPATTLPLNVIRMYYRGGAVKQFVIQFHDGAQDYYATLSLTANSGGAVSWFISSTPF